MATILSLFPARVRAVNEDGTFTPEFLRALSVVADRVGGALGIVYASSISTVPSGSLTAVNAQSALNQLDSIKVPTTRTVNGHALSADVSITAADVGAPAGSGNSSGTNTGDQTITLTGDVTGSGTGSFAATVGKIGGKAVSLAGSLTTAGAFASTFTMTGVTAVTFPTSGILATVDGNLGAATGTSLAVTGALSSSGTAGIGYVTGAGGTVTQTTDKTTAVTLDKTCGQIAMDAAALAAGAIVSFTLNNSTITAGDRLVLSHDSGGTIGAYGLNASCAAGSAAIYVRNNTAGSLSQAIVIGFTLIKSTTA